MAASLGFLSTEARHIPTKLPGGVLMARKVEQVRKLVERPLFELQETVTITCDKCGVGPLHEDLANVLEIYCNQDQCVNDRVRMDLCPNCLMPIWAKICEAIGADPKDELRIGQDHQY
jgi:hypothetical protein